MAKTNQPGGAASGSFESLGGERYYVIRDVDRMPPFLVSLVSDSDHWMFIASNGGMTAGRCSPETALFPYTTVDKLYDSPLHTGSRTVLLVDPAGEHRPWEPFNREQDGRFRLSRNLYKHVLGNTLLFEEINHDLQLTFRYRWRYSQAFGFVRESEIVNNGPASCRVELLDGLQNILPAGTPRFTQTNSSYLVDAYKWSELHGDSGLALYTLFSAITDRAEPCEALRANAVFCLGLDRPRILLSSEQLDRFRHGRQVEPVAQTRGIRAAYLVNTELELAPQDSRKWQLVADIELDQAEVAELANRLSRPSALAEDIEASVQEGADTLARILAAADGFQLTAEENVSAHHCANVLFNVLRGGIFQDQYRVSSERFRRHVALFNRGVYQDHAALLEGLPPELEGRELLARLRDRGCPQLERLGYEYLPIHFGRRHGDPSRPWNQFAIELTDAAGEQLLTYQGNWRDIFQNWEALLLSYPQFIENVIAKFVNASTVDGYNPYRITQDGIDWEVEDPEDPWSYIGYWGDHQVIYLLKLLELSREFAPARLRELLYRPLFSYANVPYRIKPFADLVEDPKSTILYDTQLAEQIEQAVQVIGMDGKLLLDGDGGVYQVTLFEKLLVTLLCKLGNLVVDGGLWLNTQRPEWNDANNALVGQGLSMVTLYYLRRYVSFLQELLEGHPNSVPLSREVSLWLEETATAVQTTRQSLGPQRHAATERYQLLADLGQAASRYRQSLYENGRFKGLVDQAIEPAIALLGDALAVIDHSIALNIGKDGLYHAYNLLELTPEGATVEGLYPMLEGQVAALSSGAIPPGEAVAVLQALYESEVFRPDQATFMLYPDRRLPNFLEKNCIPEDALSTLPVVTEMQQRGDRSLLQRDANGTWRFNADLVNTAALSRRIDELAPVYGEPLDEARGALCAVYEQVFNHKAFTGRSGGMFGFEGLGSIYWHMVAKLLLAVQENFFRARASDADSETCRELAGLYYRVRAGIGFNKTPEEYGAFPVDPYSHTPKHSGAQQPGMTGQVKEEILARFGELGVRVHEGDVHIDTGLLRPVEFVQSSQAFRYLDVHDRWSELTVPVGGLAFTWCQVPVIYRLDDSETPALRVEWNSGERQSSADLSLPPAAAAAIFQRDGQVAKIELVCQGRQLFSG